ncbi:MAG: hypothetical protein R2851_05200 [Caldilineaceae bacterium]
MAKLIALTLADEFVEERTAYYAQQDKSDRIEVKIRSRAIGYDQIQPKPALNAIAGAMLGLLFRHRRGAGALVDGGGPALQSRGRGAQLEPAGAGHHPGGGEPA